MFEFLDSGLVPLVKCPLLDSLRADKARLQEELHVFAGRRLADAQFPGDQDAAYAVGDEVSVNLRREVSAGVLQPPKNLPSAGVGQCAQCEVGFHIDN